MYGRRHNFYPSSKAQNLKDFMQRQEGKREEKRKQELAKWKIKSAALTRWTNHDAYGIRRVQLLHVPYQRDVSDFWRLSCRTQCVHTQNSGEHAQGDGGGVKCEGSVRAANVQVDSEQER